ncbi:MAG: RNA-binding domain-containing protein [Candidatus Cloacimonadaceae bacterium]
MLKKEVLKIIATGENARVEFKRDDLRPEQLAREIVALANHQGGYLILGVEDDGTISGIHRAGLQEWIMDTVCGRYIHPRITPNYTEIDIRSGLKVALISIKEGNSKPYVLRHHDREDIYLRHGSITRIATREELVGLLASSGMLQVEALPVPRTSLSSLDMARLENYLLFRGEPEAPKNKDTWTELLLQMGFLTEAAGDEIQCTVAGITLFGIKPKRYLKQAGLRVMAFDSLDLQYRALLDVVLDGPMLARWVFDDDGVRTIVDGGLVERLANTIHPFISIEGDAIDRGFRRPSKTLYPMEAIRELILNALAHRDWTRSTDIELRIFSNRLEIISPGALPGTMTIQKMKAGQRYARNPLIMEVLREYNYVEERGMGIRTKVIPQVKAITGKEPGFTADEDCLMITMHRDETTIEAVNETGNASINAPINAAINAPIKLTDTQNKIISSIRDNPSVSYDMLAYTLSVNRATVMRNIQILKKAGIITRMGSKKTGYWQVNNE